MRNKQVFIIAEAGVNHNGNINLAFKLCDEAQKAGADIIKFQTYITEDIITDRVEKASYQKKNTEIQESQYSMLKKLELSYDDFWKIKKHCDEIGIMFASTADTPKDLDALEKIGIPLIKIGSGDIGNVSYLRYCGSKGLPIILSTGMSSLADIDISLQALRDGGARDITLLHCTTSYPCTFENVNLNAMNTLKEAFKLPVGYSDHTLGNTVAIAAVAMGAKVIEKHFTLDKNMEGPDHKASSSPEEFASLVREIRNIEIAMGNGKKEATEVEKEISKVVLKKIVAKRPIKEGQIITEEDICVKRNDVGLDCNKWDLIIGTKSKKQYLVDDGIEF